MFNYLSFSWMDNISAYHCFFFFDIFHMICPWLSLWTTSARITATSLLVFVSDLLSIIQCLHGLHQRSSLLLLWWTMFLLFPSLFFFDGLHQRSSLRLVWCLDRCKFSAGGRRTCLWYLVFVPLYVLVGFRKSAVQLAALPTLHSLLSSDLCVITQETFSCLKSRFLVRQWSWFLFGSSWLHFKITNPGQLVVNSSIGLAI